MLRPHGEGDRREGLRHEHHGGDGCAESKDDEPLHPEVQKLLRAAARESKRKRRGRAAALPMPVKKFLPAAVTLKYAK